MPLPSLFRSLFSGGAKPTSAAPLFRHIKQANIRRIVEMGMGDGVRAQHMLELMLKQRPPEEVRYTGIDLFEARPDGSQQLALKSAHGMLSTICDGVRLVPGNPGAALRRCANELRGTDLVLVAYDQDQASLLASWHFLPRMLHNESQVWLEQEDGTFEILSPADVRARVAPRRAAA